MLFGLDEDALPSTSAAFPSPAREGEPPSKRPNTGTTFPSGSGVQAVTPPPPRPPPPPLAIQSEESLSHSVMPLVSEMQMTLSILQKLLSCSTPAEDHLLAQQVFHLVNKSLHPLSNSIANAAQQHIKSWSPPALSWQQETADATLTDLDLAPSATTPELGDTDREGYAPIWSCPVSTTTPTHPMTTSTAPLQSGGGTVPVAVATHTSGPVCTVDRQQCLTWSNMTTSDEEFCPPSHIFSSHSSAPVVGYALPESDSNHSGGLWPSSLWPGSLPHNQTTQPTELGPLSAGVQSCPEQLSLSSILGCQTDSGPSTCTNSSVLSTANGLKVAQMVPGLPLSQPSTASPTPSPPPADSPNPSTQPEEEHGSTYVVSFPLACIPCVPSLISYKHNWPISDEADVLTLTEKLVTDHSTPVKMFPVNASNVPEVSKVVPLPPLSPISMVSTASPSDQSSPPPPPEDGPGPSGVSSAAGHSHSGTILAPAVAYGPFGSISAPTATCGPSGPISAPTATRGPSGPISAPTATCGPSGLILAPAATYGPSGLISAPAAANGPSNSILAPAATYGPSGLISAPAAANGPSSSILAPTATYGPSGLISAPAAANGPSSSILAPTATYGPSGLISAPAAANGPSSSILAPTATYGPSGTNSTPTASNDPLGPTLAPTADHNSTSFDDPDLDSDDDFTDSLMLSLELPDDDDDDNEVSGPSASSRASAPSAAVQVWAPVPVRDYSSYDLMTSLPHVGVADRQEKLTSEGFPLYWSICVRCSPRCTSTYHMLRLEDGMELDRVASKLHAAQMDVISVYRVQNEVLWQRYRSEQTLMLQGAHSKGYKLNEAWLYHTTSAPVEVICEEGLDPRLAHAGNFGSGTYFSDDPMKCFQYVKRSAEDSTYHMLFCRVLLGDIKVYRHGTHDPRLRREPLKDFTRPGEKRTYDSVQGNLSGHNEFVVYNAYRVLPEYVIEYSSNDIDARERRRAIIHVVHRPRTHRPKGKGKI